ncbi:hypothetical protein EV148_102463 [Dokdonella fugitiva]|jgi:hypothetical protein|uniref:Uncharacterized protein n=1 Tax=Dokdonella fugitiva TaxID=328517 RepID=A0A4R2IC38_9GAMM|nr:hypothetical protein [Dokdonella fugitiva]TCO42104.1 hypothetical protein EV148_102463 [Dokdonella fugitiva]
MRAIPDSSSAARRVAHRVDSYNGVAAQRWTPSHQDTL